VAKVSARVVPNAIGRFFATTFKVLPSQLFVVLLDVVVSNVSQQVSYCLYFVHVMVLT